MAWEHGWGWSVQPDSVSTMTKPSPLKTKIVQLRRLLDLAEQSKREARTLHVSAEFHKGRISALHDAIEILES